MHLMMANQGGNSLLRDYRKGNWTIQETMVLIEAKKMDDERRMKRHGESEGRSKPAELRWKWIEDYCWRNGCLRSQNQCNDKWDNLMREFKKVRDYERRLTEKGGEGDDEGSYWKMEKNERKERNLPSNMMPQIYKALVEVVERKGAQMVVGVGVGSNSNANMCYVVERPTASEHPSLPVLQHPISPPVAVLPLPPPPIALTAVAAAAAPPNALPYSQPLPTIDSDTSEYSDSPAKRRRRGGGGGEGTSGTATASGSNSNEVGSAISKSASIIAEAIQACEEREERRHRELLNLHERRLQIEESKTEINRQGINGLVDAINKLANSIFSLAAHKNQPTDPK
ncbi:hypothetical protein F0562_019534 [Nyssa sinensis]|uniref:Myb-like domain-containing protein n=1 Tax=Nyssa sinensis TaxID=561372 RepID=A0A5J5BSP8_9ASTE|nr:hypothetical protein F0562_019534 [Nyssa sinensis]